MLVKDICPGPNSSTPMGMTRMGNRVYFEANDGAGSELWSSDGTDAGTMMLRPLIIPISYLIEEHPDAKLLPIGGNLFFSAREAPYADWELWKSDGTPAGTV